MHEIKIEQGDLDRLNTVVTEFCFAMNVRPVVLLDVFLGDVEIPPNLAHHFADHLMHLREMSKNAQVLTIYERLHDNILYIIRQLGQTREKPDTTIRTENYAVSCLHRWANADASSGFTFTEVRLATGLDTVDSDHFFINWENKYAADIYKREPDHDLNLGFGMVKHWKRLGPKEKITVNLANIKKAGVNLMPNRTSVHIVILQKEDFRPTSQTLRQIAMKVIGTVNIEPDVRGMDRTPVQALTRLNGNNKTRVRDLVARCRKVSELIPDNNLAVSEIEAIATALEALSFLDNTDISLLRKITSLLVRTIKPLTGRAGKVAKWVVQISDGVDKLDAELKRQEDTLQIEANNEPALSDD